ncbi:putative transcription factor interactor and regulator C3H-WRC/GRF family [Dioscorea sansibarensis]
MDSALIVSHETQNKNRSRSRTITAASEGESLSTLQHPQKLMRSATHAHYLSSSLQHAFHQTSPLGSQGGVLRGFSFTSAQWQELQRQALVFKHFMASVPVPPDLLLPSSAKCFPEAPPHLLFYTNNSIGVGGGCYRFSAGGDPEPGRCRRTDGKKWRCSRDVEPGMKYCERHVHRGRPRSRKPVELLHKTTKLTTTTTTPTPDTAPPSTTHQLPVFKFPFQSMEPPTKDPRYVEPGSHEWEPMHLKMELGSDPVLQHYEDQYHNLNYTTLNNHCYPFLSPDLSSLEDPPRSFIDAWSNENSVKTTTTSVSTVGKLPLSTLTLSMSGIAEETDQIEMGLSLSDIGIVKSQTSSWMGSGGPLAEVLHNNGCSSNSSRNSCGELMNLMGNGSSHEASPEDSPVRPVSSPSGVLQKALASISDSSSSSSSSPTLATTTSKQDMALRWLNQSK